MQISNMKGKAALVTGAASGLGRATAIKLAAAGANVCLVDLNAAGLQETARPCSRPAASTRWSTPDGPVRAGQLRWRRGGRRRAFWPAGCPVQHRRDHIPGQFARDAGRTMAQDPGRQPFRTVLPVTGGHPAPARGQWRDRQCRLLRRVHRRGLCRRLLRDQGRAGESHQGDGHGVHEAADPDQCGGTGRDDHQHRRQLPPARRL
jgi:hypothetical protein